MHNRLLTYVYAYYDNPRMYLRQVEEWQSYPVWLKKRLFIVVTDDCSSKYPLRDIPNTLKDVKIRRFELTEKVPWNWLACRNLGARVAKTPWLLLTDMDHLVSAEHGEKIFSFLLSPKARFDWVYLFTRLDAPYLTEYKPHNDSFMMSKQLFWRIGGYDEELAGNYGTSGRYRNRAFAVAEGNKRLDIPLIRYPREVIPDASTTEFTRKGPDRDPEAISRIEKRKIKEKRRHEIRTLSFPYREIK